MFPNISKIIDNFDIYQVTIDPLEVKSFTVTSDKIETVDWFVNRILFEGGLCVSVCLFVFMCAYICVLFLHACKCVCVIMFAMGGKVGVWVRVFEGYIWKY